MSQPSTNDTTKSLDIRSYLDADERKDLLRLLTAGSVDDGKSTLIGRLLYDSKKLYDDQLAALERDSKRVGNAGDSIDYALLLDGLKAEREEGITIDVAYRYFSTNRRKFIIADTPGHEQYTRNMITGGSTANLAIILIDARKGVITQTRRHTFLVSLLGIKHIVLAVNKMDLVGFDRNVFDAIVADYRALTDHLGIDDVTCFPLSARDGDNVVRHSPRTPWYEGPALLDFLETVPIHADRNFSDFRFPVQYVVRPDLNFRGFAGKVASGVVRVGDTVMALPSMKSSRVKEILTPGSGELVSHANEAFPPQSVTITLEDEIDISRGEMLVHPDRPDQGDAAQSKNLPHIGRLFTTMLVWMDEEPMNTDKQFFLKHNTNTTRATIAAIRHRIDVNTLEKKEGKPFQLNEIGQVDIHTAKTLFFDAYSDNRQTGAFILIDPITNNTSAVGMILAPIDEDTLASDDVPTLDLPRLGITAEHYDAVERAVRDLSRQGIEVKLIK
ncbi:MAG: sulfate adenylyltransferase subunit CysN [Bacteroidaceae bacterium]|nr:sulfate adenylyltransferase subunit CysN [Bacteroidaceae bacterium]